MGSLRKSLSQDTGTVMLEYVLLCVMLFASVQVAGVINMYWNDGDVRSFGVPLLGFGSALQNYFLSISHTIALPVP